MFILGLILKSVFVCELRQYVFTYENGLEQCIRQNYLTKPDIKVFTSIVNVCLTLIV